MEKSEESDYMFIVKGWFCTDCKTEMTMAEGIMASPEGDPHLMRCPSCKGINLQIFGKDLNKQ